MIFLQTITDPMTISQCENYCYDMTVSFNSNTELLLNICEKNVCSYISKNNTKLSSLKISRFPLILRLVIAVHRKSKLMGSNVI